MIFISDLHLGSKRCQAEKICHFLISNPEHRTIYVIGDLFDLDVAMRHWPCSHREVIELLLKRNVKYLPGNHDAALRALLGLCGDRISIAEEAIYTACSGKRYLITHGDRYDQAMMFNGPHWLRSLVSKTVSGAHSKFISDIVKRRSIADARRLGMDGVICGHTHHPDHDTVDGIEYVNCGDWVQHCTAVIEQNDSEMKLVTFT